MHHDEIIGMIPKASKAQQDFQMLNESMKDVLRAKGIAPVRVPVNKGDVVLWRSDLVHCGAPPVGARENFRAVVYVCCLPALLTPASTYPLKELAYHQLETGCHWPCREEWFKVVPKRHNIGAIRPYFSKPPPLTAKQRKLHGLDRYDAEDEGDENGGGGAGVGGASRGDGVAWAAGDGR